MTFGAPRNSARRTNRGDASDTQSQDSLRARARRRLIGAVALVLLGVIVFPLVFDSKPKPVPSTIALDIPSQSKAPGLSVPASAPMLAAASAVAVPSGERAAVAQSAPAPAVAPKPVSSAAAEKSAPKPVPVAPAAPVSPAAPNPTVTTEAPQPAAKPVAAPKPPVAPQHTKELASARQALAALEGKSPEQITVAQAEAALAHKKQPVQQDAVPSNARFVVQAGAFADAHTAQTVRNKIEKAGFKTYTQVVDTPQGKRVRVRVGPFASREDAERALHQLQRIGLSGAVLTL
ncbi:MAG: sporulation protein [Thiomonas sp. 20-64-5]|nr:MAG: sporulation protein [Thiomonas sp. 20-64-5]